MRLKAREEKKHLEESGSICENVQGLLEVYVHKFNLRLVRILACFSFIRMNCLGTDMEC